MAMDDSAPLERAIMSLTNRVHDIEGKIRMLDFDISGDNKRITNLEDSYKELSGGMWVGKMDARIDSLERAIHRLEGAK